MHGFLFEGPFVTKDDNICPEKVPVQDIDLN